MTLQDALQVAGIVSCIVAVLLAVLTVYSFVSQDIPAVWDDLSGRKRQRDLKRVLEAQYVSATGVSRMPAVSSVPVEDLQTEVMYHMATEFQAEDRTVFFEVTESVVLSVYASLTEIEREFQ